MSTGATIIGCATLCLCICACSPPEPPPPTLFELLSPETTDIGFVNQLDYTEDLNTYTYRSFYNGAGVALGDIDNDGLLDIYFSGNLVPNQLYRNLGNWQFEEIASAAGVACPDVWSSGVSLADVNDDGFLDLYVCKSGPPGGDQRHNELFINNGDLTFTERSAELGLYDEGLSTHACFFDYDNDGDLDFYLLNNSIRSVGGYDLREGQREVRDPDGGNKLYRNNLIESGTLSFTDVSEAAGIYGSDIGFGLGATVGDINRDGWQDIFVSNDFFEKDYLYINNGDGTFTEALEEYMSEISLSSMGADMADINNDGYPEIYVTDMLPWREDRIKTKTAFDNWDKYVNRRDNGFYRQFTRNVLQLNNRGQSFSEISRYAGVHATDWSWGALIFDADNDGLKDIFVANGIYKDLTDQDYVNFISRPEFVREILREEGRVIKRLIDSIPSEAVANCAFRNVNGLRFDTCAASWGLNTPSFSNGAAYGDLDNDGDADLVVNNVNMPAFIYRNRQEHLFPENHTVTLVLDGPPGNGFGLGAQVTVMTTTDTLYQNHMPMKSYQSTTDHRVLFGVGAATEISQIIVEWPGGTETRLGPAGVDTTIIVSYTTATAISAEVASPTRTMLTAIEIPGLSFEHRENSFVDFDRDRLMLYMKSNEGPCLCNGDVNADGLDDLFIGGAKDQAGGLFVQRGTGHFSFSDDSFAADAISEDTDCVFFDSDGDGDLDLYVTSGGSEFPATSSALLDRLYINDGTGGFSKSDQLLPVASYVPTSCVRPADFDGDGDLDLFVGGRMRPFLYGTPVDGYLLVNDGGRFRNATSELAPEFTNIGMITDAVWADADSDTDPDLLVVGEWMSIRLFTNRDGKLQDASAEAGLDGLSGLWNCIAAADLDQDGDLDFVVGNHGLNARLRASPEEPLELLVHDFDRNGTVEQIVSGYNEGVSYPFVLRQDLVMQMPELKNKYLKFRNYKYQTVNDIFSQEQLEGAVRSQVRTLETMILVNQGGNFTPQALPPLAQLAPVYAIAVLDLTNDGKPDILCGGNQHKAKPEIGIQDASYGLLLGAMENLQFKALPPHLSGVHIRGQIRNILPLRAKDQDLILIARNDDTLLTYAVSQ